MGKQYTTLTQDDMAFIKKQKLFYLASVSDKEVNLSPKGYDSIRVLNKSTLLFMSYPGSGNRTYRDATNDGKFTLVFNAFDGTAQILRLFCTAVVINPVHKDFSEYAKTFGLKESQVRDFFLFNIYAVESSCGMSVPLMEYKEDRNELRNWVKSMDKKDKLDEYKEKHFTPVNLENIEMKNFLKETTLVDFSHKRVAALASSLSRGTSSDEEIAKRCFTYVRDEINHSGDYKDDVTTLSASSVLKHGTGWCYTKSILLAALLRANKIPTGFCYQRLSCSEYAKDSYCLHGLNAIYLKEFGWYRVDARGNKEGVNAIFRPPYEQLAFELQEHEYDLEEIYEEPLAEVVEALEKFTSYDEMIHNFPDIKKH